ncbi:MAG: hypothetical protein WA190_09740 [Usitatibacter sp.]
MRRLVPVVLCSMALFAQAETIASFPAASDAIDLDKPGALDALQRDNPRHYEEVMKKVDEAQTVAYTDKTMHNLGLFFHPGSPGRSGDLKLSDPAKSRITVAVDGTTYLITVRYTKDPAHPVPAR